MARQSRIHYPGGIYHLISRFVNDEYLIRGAVERRAYLEFLGKAAGKTDAIILAYCVMSNHIHLVVRAGNEPLERLMKSTHSGFAGWLNGRSNGRKGPVFRDRYKSILVEEDSYLHELIRYVHNNPVRAHKVKYARKSSWSSHGAYMGDLPVPKWLNTGYVLSMFNEKMGWARRQFDGYVNEAREEGRRRDLNGEGTQRVAKEFSKTYGDAWRISGPVVGSDEFAARVMSDLVALDSQVTRVENLGSVSQQRPSLDEVTGIVCAEVGVELWDFEHRPKSQLAAFARKLIVYLWVVDCGGKQADVARKLNASSASVTGWYSKAIQSLPDIEPVLDRIRSQFPTFLATMASDKKIRYSFEMD
jgi:REP element-mobilizing transposase RayT